MTAVATEEIGLPHAKRRGIYVCNTSPLFSTNRLIQKCKIPRNHFLCSQALLHGVAVVDMLDEVVAVTNIRNEHVPTMDRSSVNAIFLLYFFFPPSQIVKQETRTRRSCRPTASGSDVDERL